LDQPFDRVCSYVVARCRSRKAAPGSEKWISVTSNRTSIFHGRGLANGGYPVESVSRPKGVTRGSRKRSRARRAAENRVAMAKSRDRKKADSAVRKIGDDLPGRIEDSVTLRWKAPRIVGAAVSSRGLWTSGLGDLRRLRGREAPEARSESNRGRRQGCQRLGLASRHGEENAPMAIEGKRQSQGPPKRIFGVVNHRVLRTEIWDASLE